ncbi:MAG: PaaI family thioesterase [Pseudomonadota bacterium]|nr:PaaI family thioesterase [Pseudomonadota bacterium]
MVSKDQMIAFFRSEFPNAGYVIEDFTDNSIKVREQDLRPGGTVSGPTMMALADTALYVALLREIGLVSLAVTTSLNFNFLRKPVADRDLLAECKLLKQGKSLAVGEVTICSEGDEAPVAHATGTYSIPPNR